MIIPCPHCQAKLNLPENVEGKQVRCPNCRQVFRADKEALQESVQEGRPEPAPTAVTPKPFDEEERPRSASTAAARSRDYEDDEDDGRADDWDRDDFERQVRRDSEELLENAKAQARPAGYLMLAAFVFTGLNIASNAGLTVLTERELGNLPPGPMVGIMICGVSIYVVPLIFMLLAGRALLALGSRGVIITAIVMNFILFFILGAGALANVAVLTMGQIPVPLYLVLPIIVMNSISCLLNLGAAVMAIRVLMLADVREAYAMQSANRVDLSRRRRY